MPTDFPENPLPPCPDVPNCVRETRHFKAPPDKLFSKTLKALYAIKPATVEVDEDAHRIDAVFRILLFKDDVVLKVEPYEAGAVVHVRSESRLGRGDLGVNRRRVDRFFDALGKEVKA